jgi:hypothetical protein
MSLVVQLTELENQKRQLLGGALAEIQPLIDAVNQAGYDYTLVSPASEAVAPATARAGKQRKQRPMETGVMAPYHRIIVSALTDVVNTDENALALDSRMATLSDTDLWHAQSYFYPKFHNLGSISRSNPFAFQANSFQQMSSLWGGRPRPRGSPWTRSSSRGGASSGSRGADGGVGRGPGVRPTNACRHALQAAFSRNLNLPALAGSHQFPALPKPLVCQLGMFSGYSAENATVRS